ncbi:hypothetical protein ACFL0Q_07140 [Thermodesulfobacteriota bacterium]
MPTAHSPPSSLAPPVLSKETLDYLGSESLQPTQIIPAVGLEEVETKYRQPETEAALGRWGIFRKLLTYYRQCIRNEEGADASAFQNELGKRFLYLRKTGRWRPRPGMGWRASIPLGPHLSPMINALPSSAADHALVVGYPIQAFYKEKEDEPDVAIVRPVFYFAVEHTISRDGLVLSCEDPRLEVNLGWLDYAFSRKPERQRGFLSACGLVNRWQPNDEAPALERGELAPSLDNLVAALAAFMPERMRQPLKVDSIPDHPLRYSQ